jgi:hypothetical protein
MSSKDRSAEVATLDDDIDQSARVTLNGQSIPKPRFWDVIDADQRDYDPSVDELIIVCSGDSFIWNSQHDQWQNTEWGYLVDGPDEADDLCENPPRPWSAFVGREVQGQTDPGNIASCPPNTICNGFAFILFCGSRIENTYEQGPAFFLTLAQAEEATIEEGGTGLKDFALVNTVDRKQLRVYSVDVLAEIYRIANMKKGKTAPPE